MLAYTIHLFTFQDSKTHSHSLHCHHRRRLRRRRRRQRSQCSHRASDLCGSQRLLKEFSRQRDGMRQLKSNAERDAPIVKDEGNALPLTAQLESFPVTSVAEREAAL